VNNFIAKRYSSYLSSTRQSISSTDNVTVKLLDAKSVIDNDDHNIISGSNNRNSKVHASRGKNDLKIDINSIDANILSKLKVGKAEQFIFVFSQIPLLEVRLTCMAHTLSRQEVSKTVVSSSEKMLHAVTEIKGSERLKFILKVILDLNNTLVKNSKASTELIGIKLDSLSKLTQFKTNAGLTVEQYVVTKIAEHYPEALTVLHDMPSIDEARQVVFPRLTADVKKIEDCIDMMKSIMDYDRNNSDQPYTRLFVNSQPEKGSLAPIIHISRFYEEIMDLYTLCSTHLDEALEDYQDLCRYFGEEMGVEPELFFGQLIKFLRSFDTTKNLIQTNLLKSKLSRPKIDYNI